MKKLRLNRQQEIDTIELMIRMYCKGRKHESCGAVLCDDCQALLEYAKIRIDRCPRKEEKTFCNTCPIHCYKPEYRLQVKEVMRYSGPRLLYRHPIIAVKHSINTMLSRR